MAQKTKLKRSKEVAAWLKQEAKEQQERYKKIAKEENEDLAPQREIWFREFEQRIQTRGFFVHSDIKRIIKPEEIYQKPKRKTKVVF